MDSSNMNKIIPQTNGDLSILLHFDNDIDRVLFVDEFENYLANLNANRVSIECKSF